MLDKSGTSFLKSITKVWSNSAKKFLNSKEYSPLISLDIFSKKVSAPKELLFSISFNDVSNSLKSK